MLIQRSTSVRQHRDDQGAFIERVENLQRVYQLESFHARPFVRRYYRRCECEGSESQARACKLTIIGGRDACGRLVLSVCLVRPMEGFR
jgi:hypothetical protein